MARYIDADALIEEINKLMKSPYAEHREPFTGMQVRKETIETVKKLCVVIAPTAFDMDAVVAELEKESYQEWCDSPRIVELKDAIEIVRKGGVHE